MKKTWVITIGREYCSGGAEVARILSERLDIPYYDRDLIDRAVSSTNLSLEQVLANEERPDGKLLDPYGKKIYRDDPSLTMPTHARIFDAQCEAIRHFAGEGPCIIVGRCADYVLSECSRVIDILSVFVHADIGKRKSRAMRLYGISEDEAETAIRRTDKIRMKYYNAHTGKEWGTLDNYDLIIDTGKFGTEGAADLINAALKEMLKKDETIQL